MIAQFKKITLAVALGVSALAVAAPAEAQRYEGYRGRDNGGAAVVAGIEGLAIGAALASSVDRRENVYYDQGYPRPVVVYPQGYNGYYDGGYREYDHHRGYDGYYANRRDGGYDRGRGYGDYGRGGPDGYRR